MRAKDIVRQTNHIEFISICLFFFLNLNRNHEERKFYINFRFTIFRTVLMRKVLKNSSGKYAFEQREMATTIRYIFIFIINFFLFIYIAVLSLKPITILLCQMMIIIQIIIPKKVMNALYSFQANWLRISP